MANEQNLINFRDRTHEEMVEMGRKGQKASAQKKREKKLLRETLEQLLLINDNQNNVCVALMKKHLMATQKHLKLYVTALDKSLLKNKK